MATNRLLHIDVWRFIAIAMVLIYHVGVFSHPWYQDVVPGIVWRLKLLGPLGVQIFFCISGFVICRGMMSEKERTGSVGISAFYVRRAYRILPALAVYILCVAFFSAIGVFDVPWSSLALASTFLCNIAMHMCGWELGHTWSLAYEEQFYLLFPLFFISADLALRRQRILIAGLVLTGILFAARLVDFPKVGEYLGHFLFMLAGCMCALYWKELEPKMQALSTPMWAASVVLLAATCLFSLPEPVKQFVLPVLLPMLICIAVFGTPMQHRHVRPLFSNPLLTHLGRISYGIYLWQQLATADYGFNSPLYALALVAAALVLSHYSFVYFETPLIRRGAEASSRATVAAKLPFVDPKSGAASQR